MARERFAVADSDMHVIEPADLWLNYIDPRFKARAPVGLTEVPRDVAIEWEGKRIPNNTSLSRRMLQVVQAGQADRYAHAERRGYDAVAQVEAMDQEGIDVAVLFPSRGLFALAVDGMDPELAAAIARAYNEWLAHFCAENPKRLLGAAMLAPHDVDAAVAEARRTVTELGFRAMFMRQCWVSIECDEEPGVHAAETLADNIVFSTDYPHGDSKYPRATERFLRLPLAETAARRILWDNWARLYGF